jgi:type VI secretion system (T6SS) effector TldE1-like protein
MLHKPYPLRRSALRKNRRGFLLPAALVAISLSPLAYFADFQSRTDAPPAAPLSSVSAQAPAAASAFDPALVDPAPALKTEALNFAQNAPLQAAFKLPPLQREAGIAPLVPPPPQEPPQPSAPVQSAQAAPPMPVFAPLPVPRPADLRAPRPTPAAQMASAPVATAIPLKTAALPGTPEDNRSFLEKLFGVRPASTPDAALAYAALDKGTGSISPTARFSPTPDLSAGTAVYDITAQVVIMPSGERLEAHSGLGDKMDDPRYVNVRMKGATPPGTYILTEREALFHGVRALRLTPVGGSSAIYGRDGILAHTYLLGPRGDSNGCVSFKNYDRFLQAYLRGEVKRLIVTAGRGQDLLPRIANNRTGLYRRSARNG